jgi:hypothetical protein
MDIKTTYETIALWLNSCITAEQIDLCVEAADTLLLERHGAVKEFEALCLTAANKREVPSTVAAWDEGVR